jgi:hypothetical protein
MDRFDLYLSFFRKISEKDQVIEIFSGGLFQPTSEFHFD